VRPRSGYVVDLAVIGIGASFSHRADVFSDMLTSKVVRDIHKYGAVGHVLGRFIDYRSRPVPNPLNDLVVGVTFNQLRRIPLGTRGRIGAAPRRRRSPQGCAVVW
jgi:DNA-binding transcriptional regulator LsrR (DeoR family)